MNKNNSIVEYKESFIMKIKNFFKKIFGKNEEVHSTTKNNIAETEIIKNSASQKNFFEDLKVDSADIDNVINKKNFLEEIDRNVEALKLLSVDRLRKLEKYYDGLIKKNDEKIKKLKANA